MNQEDIKLYLPKYLSAESKNALIDALKEFPSTTNDRFYTSKLSQASHIFQGDGLKDLIIVNLPDTANKKVRAIVLSNTCDIAPENDRLFFPARIIYSPLIELQKYQTFLLNKGITEEKLKGHIHSIKSQSITQIFYLPGIDGILEESIVFFDRVLNVDVNYLSIKELNERRIFTLGNYGHYLLLFKLSFHFCRFQDQVDRDATH